MPGISPKQHVRRRSVPVRAAIEEGIEAFFAENNALPTLISLTQYQKLQLMKEFTRWAVSDSMITEIHTTGELSKIYGIPCTWNASEFSIS